MKTSDIEALRRRDDLLSGKSVCWKCGTYFGFVWSDMWRAYRCKGCGTTVQQLVAAGEPPSNFRDRPGMKEDLMETKDFGWAIRMMKAGVRVRRAGWNGKGMWIVLILPGNAMHTSAAGGFNMQPCIGMKTADDKMQPGWLASQADMLGTDWEVAD